MPPHQRQILEQASLWPAALKYKYKPRVSPIGVPLEVVWGWSAGYFWNWGVIIVWPKSNTKTSIKAWSFVVRMSATMILGGFSSVSCCPQRSSSEPQNSNVFQLLRAKVYDQLSRAQNGCYAGKPKEKAFSILDEVKGKANSMNSWWTSLWCIIFMGFYSYI